MKRVDWNQDWEFYEADESTSFCFGRPKAVTVDLPHDFIIHKPRRADAPGGAGNGYFGEGEGVYQKTLMLDDAWKDQSVLMDIDGAYMNAEVSVNKEILALHPNGYTPFLVDLTPALRFDKNNRIKIITQSRQPSSRWYSGGGLYRGVSLWVGGRIAVRPWDLFIRTQNVTTENARILVTAKVTRDPARKETPITVACRITYQGNIVSETDMILSPNAEKQGEVWEANCSVDTPQLWSIETPVLYECEVEVRAGEELLDAAAESFGIRSVTADAKRGLLLNGKPVKIKGGCIHHDNGLLGACAYPQAEERKIKLLKKAGYNAVRISHNPPSLALLEACDRLGMLVLDEAFDVWRLGKAPMDYHLYFEDWWERDIEAMVKRDRNHPCVISYSIGNEISESNGRNQGAVWSRRLSDAVRKWDPDRFILSAICAVNMDTDTDGTGGNLELNLKKDNNEWARQTYEFCRPLDIVGYNYLPDIYESSHENYPDRVILATETRAFDTYDYWKKAASLPYVIGDCIWAAVDYLGEAGVGKVYWKAQKEEFSFMGSYPWRTSWQSDIDLTGEQRPQSVYRQIMWGDEAKSAIYTTHPKHYKDSFYGMGWHWYDVNDSWTFEKEYQGKPVQVDVYGAGDEAELWLNGRSLGKKSFDKLIASFEVPYEEGRLEAIVYRGEEILSSCQLETCTEADHLALYPEKDEKPGELRYVRILLEDAMGRRLTWEERSIHVEVEGAQFLAVGGASPCTEDQIGDKDCHLFRGSALLIIKKVQEAPVRVKVQTGTIMLEEVI